MTGALATDLYELNMAASYLRREMVGPATFSLFVRNLPPGRGFLVASGLEDCLAFLERFCFDAASTSRRSTRSAACASPARCGQFQRDGSCSRASRCWR